MRSWILNVGRFSAMFTYHNPLWFSQIIFPSHWWKPWLGFHHQPLLKDDPHEFLECHHLESTALKICPHKQFLNVNLEIIFLFDFKASLTHAHWISPMPPYLMPYSPPKPPTTWIMFPWCWSSLELAWWPTCCPHLSLFSPC
jgi:hypothetical protein